MAMVVAGQHAIRRHRRPHLDLRLGGHAVRSRLQPLLPRRGAPTTPATTFIFRATPRPAFTPGLPRRPADRREPRELPPGDCAAGGGLSSLSASLADARLLAVPHGVDGLGPDHGHLPGPLQSLPARPRHQRHRAARDVWCFLGDGESDEPETLGAITLASREKLDNLIFVINCNLQRLDGPVRGNGKIIQELEARLPRRRLERHQGHLGRRLGSAAGRRQRRPARQAHGRSRRRRVSEIHRRSRALTSASISSASIPNCWRWSSTCPTSSCKSCAAAATIRRRCIAAYKAAVEHKGTPTVILAKTIKGYGLGEAGEGRNIDASAEEARTKTSCASSAPASAFRSPTRTSSEAPVLPARRRQRGDEVPARAPQGAGRSTARPARATAKRLEVPPLVERSRRRSKGAAAARRRPRWPSCALLSKLLKDKEIGK